MDEPFEIVMVTRFDAATFADFHARLFSLMRRPPHVAARSAFYNTPRVITKVQVPSTPNVILYVLEMHNINV